MTRQGKRQARCCAKQAASVGHILGLLVGLACRTLRLLLQMKRLTSFQCPLEDEASDVGKILGMLKVYTPWEILLDGLSGKELFASRGNLEEN